MITTGQAIVSLRPGVEWVMDGDDVEGITWITPGQTPLSQKDVDVEKGRLQAAQEAAAVTAAANAQAAIAHAKSLGFTDAMISAMYPALVQ